MNRRLALLEEKPFPAYVVWELTLKCDQRCDHCGSRAFRARAGELDLLQALSVVASLKNLGTKEVVLIGGEAYLHENFIEIAHALHKAGISVSMTTGGQGLDLSLAKKIGECGIKRVSVSIDGLTKSHDRMRARAGSFDKALNAVKNLLECKIKALVNTTINRLNKSELEELYQLFLTLGVTSWQVQLMAPLGRAADRPGLLIEPYDLLDIMPRLAQLKKRGFKDGILIMPGNNLGYFGPQEALLRSPHEDGKDYFAGCQAGRFILGIESDGTVKGCPSMQTYAYRAGTVKEQRLEEIWHSALALKSLRNDDAKKLWGFCETCAFKETCKGGCTFTAHSFFGRAGNNPYCFYRAQHFASQGLKEKLIPIKKAVEQPFHHGLFAIELEAL